MSALGVMESIPGNLVSPIALVSLRHSAALWASVPEATVDKYREPLLWEYKIGLPWHLGNLQFPSA